MVCFTRLSFLLVLLPIFLTAQNSNYLDHPEYKCIQCLCHARTGCWRRQNCASYSINLDYWKKAGALSVKGLKKSPDSSFSACMKDEACIVGTIIEYTDLFGQPDCNCDGTFDCKDRFAIHLKGENCYRPTFGTIFSRRFNECANKLNFNKMESLEGESGCGPKPE